jgi:hypothetical protein
MGSIYLIVLTTPIAFSIRLLASTNVNIFIMFGIAPPSHGPPLLGLIVLGIFNMSLKDGMAMRLWTHFARSKKKQRNKLGLGYKRGNKLNKLKTKEFTPLSRNTLIGQGS